MSRVNKVVNKDPLSAHGHTVLMIRVATCPDICFSIVNVLASPLIMYSKLVWSNFVWLVNARVGQKMSDDWPLSSSDGEPKSRN